MDSNVQSLLNLVNASPGFFPSLLGRIMHGINVIAGKAGHDRLAVERIHGRSIVVLPEVFNPLRLRTGAFFASLLNAEVISHDADVLDMGTGSGIGAVFAARYARHVVAVDINREAVRCASINALINHVESKIEVRHGDLYVPLRGERFDLVLFNPPFLRGVPNSDFDQAWRSTNVAERFAAGLGRHLKPSGAALVLLSTYGDSARFLGEFFRHGYDVAPVATRRFVNETLWVFRVTQSGPRVEAWQ
jgi:methylase of polypeptide subunit release factors